MKTHAVIHRQVVEQIVIQAVDVDGDIKTPVSSEQVINLVTNKFPITLVGWGQEAHKELKSLGVSTEDIARLNTISARDLSLLSLLLSPRAVTKAAKTVIVGTLEGRARDIGEVIIGARAQPTPEVQAALSELRSWLEGQVKTNE